MEPVEAEDIDKGTILEINIPEIALNEKFGNLKFENASKKLSKVQEWLKEAKELSFKELLLPEQVDQLESYTNYLVEKLQWLCSFDIATIEGSPKTEHDNFENQIDGFYNGVYQTLRMQYLPFLREERRRENPKERTSDEEIRKLSQIRVNLEKELEGVRAEIEDFRNLRKEVGTAKGERAANKMGLYFDREVNLYQPIADRWFLIIVGGYGLIIILILGMAAYYTWLGDWKTITWQSATAKAVFFASLWYGLSFLIRNYNINSHLAAINRHRAAVASTLEDFLASDSSTPGEMLQNATQAMFKNIPVGFVTKTEGGSGNPMLEVINKIVSSKGN